MEHWARAFLHLFKFCDCGFRRVQTLREQTMHVVYKVKKFACFAKMQIWYQFNLIYADPHIPSNIRQSSSIILVKWLNRIITLQQDNMKNAHLNIYCVHFQSMIKVFNMQSLVSAFICIQIMSSTKLSTANAVWQTSHHERLRHIFVMTFCRGIRECNVTYMRMSVSNNFSWNIV